MLTFNIEFIRGKARFLKVSGRVFFAIILFLVIIIGCKKEESIIYDFPVNSLDKVITSFNLSMDDDISYDGLSSIRIDAKDSATAYLYLVHNIPIKAPRLIWEAYCRSQDLDGKAFLEVGVQIPERYGKVKGFLHRSRDTITGTTDWKKIEVEFLVREECKPDLVQLSLVVEGSGTVWIDKVKLTALPTK
ncbi:hypothetical protein KAW18_00910 [candidate division WOR-3 bacterium]|nr:hypothetical protein [candidate division WOR-3 bacterium]